VPVDWGKLDEFPEVHRFYRGLVRLRLDLDGARGLSGPWLNLFCIDDEAKVIAYHRFDEGGPGDDVVVVASFAGGSTGYRIGLPRAGLWRVRLDTGEAGAGGLVASEDQPWQGLDASAQLQLDAYAVIVLAFVGDG